MRKNVKRVVLVIILVLVTLTILTGCVRHTDSGDIKHQFSVYIDANTSNGFYIPISIDDDWKLVSYLFMERAYKSPDGELIFIFYGGKSDSEMYVKQGVAIPTYDNIIYDNIKVLPTGGSGLIADFLDYDGYAQRVVDKDLQNENFDQFVNKEIVHPVNFDIAKGKFQYFIQMHCTRGFSWNFHVVEFDGLLYLNPLNEDFGYLVVDEFADWLRTLEPSQN